MRIAAFYKKRFLRNLHKSKTKFFYFFGANFSQQEFPEYCTCLRIYLSLTFLCCSEEADYGQLTWDESETFPWKDKTAKSWKNLGCCLQFPTNSCKKKKQISLFNKLRDVNFFASLIYAFQSLIKLLEKLLLVLKVYNNFTYLRKFEQGMPISFGKSLFEKNRNFGKNVCPPIWYVGRAEPLITIIIIVSAGSSHLHHHHFALRKQGMYT